MLWQKFDPGDKIRNMNMTLPTDCNMKFAVTMLTHKVATGTLETYFTSIMFHFNGVSSPDRCEEEASSCLDKLDILDREDSDWEESPAIHLHF